MKKKKAKTVAKDETFEIRNPALLRACAVRLHLHILDFGVRKVHGTVWLAKVQECKQSRKCKLKTIWSCFVLAQYKTT